MKTPDKNRKSSITRHVFFIPMALIIISFFFLNREEKLEVLGCLFVASAGWLEVIKIPMKEKNPLIEQK
jgi:hypothetical protein